MGSGRKASHVLVVDGREVGEVVLADTYLRRLRGMLLRRRLPESLLLVPGGSVHGMGMTVALDVAVLVDRPGTGSGGVLADGLVVAKTALLRPLLLVTAVRGTRAVLETPVGGLARWGVGVGSLVQVRPAGAARETDRLPAQE